MLGRGIDSVTGPHRSPTMKGCPIARPPLSLPFLPPVSPVRGERLRFRKAVYSLVLYGEHDCGPQRRCPPSPLVLALAIRSRIGCQARDLNGAGTASRAYYLIEEPAVAARPVHSAAT